MDTACIADAGDAVKNGCGIHVHSGMTCDDADSISGHFFDDSISPDPWLPITYVADSAGASVGNTTLTTGKGLVDMMGRAFVVHALADGARIACAMLFEDAAVGDLAAAQKSEEASGNSDAGGSGGGTGDDDSEASKGLLTSGSISRFAMTHPAIFALLFSMAYAHA